MKVKAEFWLFIAALWFFGAIANSLQGYWMVVYGNLSCAFFCIVCWGLHGETDKLNNEIKELKRMQ